MSSKSYVYNRSYKLFQMHSYCKEDLYKHISHSPYTSPAATPMLGNSRY